MKKTFFGFFLLLFSSLIFAQSAVIRGESSPGVYEVIKTDGAQRLQISNVSTDPCQSSAVAKTSVIVNLAAAATTELVAISGTTVIYVCDFTISISQVVTTANTLKFVTGTGSACATGQTNLTGLFGAGGVTAGIPIVVFANSPGTVFKTPAGQALCVTTAIGGSAQFQGVVTYVQQ
jgi:hypothetical protein